MTKRATHKTPRQKTHCLCEHAKAQCAMLCRNKHRLSFTLVPTRWPHRVGSNLRAPVLAVTRNVFSRRGMTRLPACTGAAASTASRRPPANPATSSLRPSSSPGCTAPRAGASPRLRVVLAAEKLRLNPEVPLALGAAVPLACAAPLACGALLVGPASSAAMAVRRSCATHAAQQQRPVGGITGCRLHVQFHSRLQCITSLVEINLM